MSLLLIERQYSPSVAAARHASSLDAIYNQVKTALLNTALPDALKKIGLRYFLDGTALHAELHGYRLVERYDHVWLRDGLPIPRLGGRSRFFIRSQDGQEGDEVVRLIWDSSGNISIGKQDGYFAHVDDDGEARSFVRNASLALANAVHAKMDIIGD
ncbi:hypothetical protein [Ralstonia pickettii]|uniref:hypothetical protein n=1 Tax=Ralstonia pickettii TaxID=329 RepID=UPI001267DB4D|nr:hypothetical protein [Ralstonia pickettii]